MSSQGFISENFGKETSEKQGELNTVILPVGSEIVKRGKLAKIVIKADINLFELQRFFQGIIAIRGEPFLILIQPSREGGYSILSYLSFLGDAKDFERALKKILDELKSEKLLESYYYILPSEEGFLLDHNVYALSDIGGRKTAIFSYENLEAQFIAPRKRAGNLGSWIIEIMGESLGEILGEKLRDVCLKKGFKTCLEILHSAGEERGILHLKKIDAVKDVQGAFIRISLDRSIEEEILLEKGIRECGRHQLGIYRGFLSSVLGRKIENNMVEEIRCLSKGEGESIYIIKVPPDIPL
ncbi:MAG: hypothetical protein ACP5TH_05680 [Fervidicoccaceae archaeon]